MPGMRDDCYDLLCFNVTKSVRRSHRQDFFRDFLVLQEREKAAWEAKISRDRYQQAEAAAMIKKARIASEIEQVKLRDELDEAIRTLTKAKRKSLEAAENKYRDELQNVLLLYFFRRRFNLTFECLAQIFRFKNRSSAIRHFIRLAS